MGQLKTTIDFQFRRYFNTNSAVKRKCFLRSIGTIMIVVINSLQLAENSAKTRKSDPDHRSSQTPRITLLQSFRKIKKFYFTVCLKRYTIRYGIILHVSEVFESVEKSYRMTWSADILQVRLFQKVYILVIIILVISSNLILVTIFSYNYYLLFISIY